MTEKKEKKKPKEGGLKLGRNVVAERSRGVDMNAKYFDGRQGRDRGRIERDIENRESGESCTRICDKKRRLHRIQV